MSKKIGIPCILFVVIALPIDFRVANIIASEPLGNGKYSVQVPHVVLPETIQYKTYTNHQGSVVVTQQPATYTAFPSYSLPEGTEFRTINQLYYPVTPMTPPDAALGTVAKTDGDDQIVSSDIPDTIQRQTPDVPKIEMPSLADLEQTDHEPIFLTRLDETQNPIRQVHDNILVENSSNDSETPANSIAFFKFQRVGANVSEHDFDLFDDDNVPTRLSQVTSRPLDWLERESLFVKPVTFTEVALPTQLGLMQPNTGYQQAQPLPAYGGLLCRPNNNTNYVQQQFPPNPYSNGMYAAGQPMPVQSPQYQSLAQLGSIMPAMSGQHITQQPGYGMAMQQPMQPAMQQQTIGYILLYPQAAQSGVNMQLASQQVQENDGASSTGNEEAVDSNTPNLNAMQLQATFIPASQMPNFAGQSAMPQMPKANPMMPGGMNPMMPGGMNPYMMNPMMPGGMNPYMMNPMMMGGMNPYMMNPMMMGMGGMMPPIIIQMPSPESGRRRVGLFARLRAVREESQNRTQQASGSLASLFTQPGQMPQGQMPAKAAYPYGYFGATASPYQSGNFGGYHDMSTQTVRYPGM